MQPHIAAFLRDHQLPPDLLDPLLELIARSHSLGLTHASGASIALPDPEAGDEATVAPPRPSGDLPPRYQDLGRLGAGGMGEVRRVRDRELGRTCAFKILRPDLVSHASLVSRFVEEAQVAAQLQHPNIAPVYDAGSLADGRAWFTMKEVRGRTLTELVGEAHASPGGPSDATIRRLCDAFAKVCDGVGYAHARGVVHRDLKPDNVMIGVHGEVLVLDWGLAKVLGLQDRASSDAEHEVVSTRSHDDTHRTRIGGVLGTASYMPPEQARGETNRLDARADVYALGAMLYHVLAGRPPYQGTDSMDVLRKVLAGAPPAPQPATGGAAPDDLVALCARCMSRNPTDRPSDGAAVAVEARAWLDGATRRERALEIVSEADRMVIEIDALRRRAAKLRSEGDQLLVDCRPYDPEGTKAPGWERQDEGERAEQAAALLEFRREALLQGALTHVPELPQAHAALAQLEVERHRAAESQRQDSESQRAELRVREHAEALTDGHPTRRAAVAYLRGNGALTLVTDVPGAQVDLYRFEATRRRLVAVPVRSLGPTPLHEISLAMGSYLCVLRHPERAPVRYPVAIGRGEHWDCIPPGEREPHPVRLPRVDELSPDDCVVPAGWFWSGGDPESPDSLPRRRLWCDELVVRRYPITNREYIAFLDDLVAKGREDDALRYVPRERVAIGEGAMLYGRDKVGRFVLRADADGDMWDPQWPVMLIDAFGAGAYAAWCGESWRLLRELEWEKAARGVDGRFLPWGDFHDPSWSCMRQSHAGRPLPVAVDSFPVDMSVYGVRGLAGNAQDWCADEFRRDGTALVGVRVPSHPVDEHVGARVLRGGNWVGSSRGCRSAYRYRAEAASRGEGLGFRIARGQPSDVLGSQEVVPPRV